MKANTCTASARADYKKWKALIDRRDKLWKRLDRLQDRLREKHAPFKIGTVLSIRSDHMNRLEYWRVAQFHFCTYPKQKSILILVSARRCTRSGSPRTWVPRALSEAELSRAKVVQQKETP